MAKNILNIDDHYIRYPKDAWGGTDLNNPDLVNPWINIQEIVNPTKVIEIGMWAGHASLVMMTVFKNLESLVSYDISEVSETNARQIKKFWPQHTFYKEPIWGNEHRHDAVDLVFVDGNHTGLYPQMDIESCIKMKTRYIVVDNIESPDVRKAVRNYYKFYDIKYEPKYYFYNNIKYSASLKATLDTPGIMGLFKLEGNYDNF